MKETSSQSQKVVKGGGENITSKNYVQMSCFFSECLNFCSLFFIFSHFFTFNFLFCPSFYYFTYNDGDFDDDCDDDTTPATSNLCINIYKHVICKYKNENSIGYQFHNQRCSRL